jgi:hypothetical protein
MARGGTGGLIAIAVVGLGAIMLWPQIKKWLNSMGKGGSGDVPVGAPFGQGQQQKVPQGTTRLGPRALHLPGGEILDEASIPKQKTTPQKAARLAASYYYPQDDLRLTVS